MTVKKIDKATALAGSHINHPQELIDWKYSQSKELINAELIVDPSQTKSRIGVAWSCRVNKSATDITVPQKLDIQVEHRTIGLPQ